MRERLGLTNIERDREKVLVTGGEGCIGAWTVRNLALAGIQTVSTDVSDSGSRLGKILDHASFPTLSFERADLREAGAIADICGRHGVTRIIHLAAMQVPFVVSDPVLGAEVNVVGTVRILEAVRHSGGKVRGLSYASSTAATGPAGAEHDPETLYGVYKLGNEHAARIYARDYGVPSIGLRPCIVYGPTRDQGLTSALTTALKAVTLGIPYRIPFAGDVDVQFAEDVATAFIRAAFANQVDRAEVYDLHGDLVSVEGYIRAVAEVAPEASDLLSMTETRVPGNVLVDDRDLVERLSGLPKTSLRDGIRASLELFAGHRESGVLSPDEPALLA